jgi:hypothetical protein
VNRTGEGSHPGEGNQTCLQLWFANLDCEGPEVRIDVTTPSTHGRTGNPITLLIITITYPLPAHQIIHLLYYYHDSCTVFMTGLLVLTSHQTISQTVEFAVPRARIFFSQVRTSVLPCVNGHTLWDGQCPQQEHCP